jgi:ribosomal protein RSM22 (predicted rRNA methylase)
MSYKKKFIKKAKPEKPLRVTRKLIKKPPPAIPTKELRKLKKPHNVDPLLTREVLRGARKSFRIGCVGVPKELQTKISEVLKGYPRKWLREDAANLSELLRSRTTEKQQKRNKEMMSDEVVHLGIADKDPLRKGTRDHVIDTVQLPPLEYNKRQSMAYVAHRVPGIYSCNFRVLSEIKRRFPKFEPVNLMDFGTGPGTAIWAAKQIWPSITSIKGVEASEDMIEINQQMLSDLDVDMKMTRFILQGEATRDKSHLVIASYSLSELQDDISRESILRTLWGHVRPKGMLVLIEPGTPIGFRIIRNARTMIQDLIGGNEKENPYIVSPCTHAFRCPLGGADNPSWCHFIQRVERLPQQLEVKRKDKAWKNFENEKFSYIIFSKGKMNDALQLQENSVNDKPISQWARLVRQPLKKGGHVILDSCGGDGEAKRHIVAKSNGKILYTSARKSRWGDVYNIELLKESLIEKSKRLKRPWKDLVLARQLKRGEISQNEYDMALDKKVHTERQWLPHEIE